jgi:DNA primase
LVEGVLDVWRIGDCAVATFGIQYSQQQVKLLSEAFERIYILYDPEPAALNQAWKLQYDLNAWGAHSMVVNYRGDHDPGDYTDEEVQTLMETIHRTEEQYEYRRSQISIGKHHNSHSRFS